MFNNPPQPAFAYDGFEGAVGSAALSNSNLNPKGHSSNETSIISNDGLTNNFNRISTENSNSKTGKPCTITSGSLSPNPRRK